VARPNCAYKERNSAASKTRYSRAVKQDQHQPGQGTILTLTPAKRARRRKERTLGSSYRVEATGTKAQRDVKGVGWSEGKKKT